jgi:hypothetical protein
VLFRKNGAYGLVDKIRSGAEVSITEIAESGDDILVFIQMAIDGCRVKDRLRECSQNTFNPFRCCHNANQNDFLAAAFFNRANGFHDWSRLAFFNPDAAGPLVDIQLFLQDNRGKLDTIGWTERQCQNFLCDYITVLNECFG